VALGVALAGLTTAPAHADHMANCRPISDQEGAMLQGRTAVVTDIDGVLTQYILQDYGPTNGAFVDRGIAYPRVDAALMMSIYHRRGYLIVYMAFRPRNLEVMGQSMCDATLAWLYDHGFPTEKGDTLLLLADAPDSVTKAADKGLAMASYAGDKGTGIIVDMIDAVKDHYAIDPQYGYVDSDVVANAFLEQEVPPDHIFTIGNKGISALGYKGTQPIMGPEPNPGYTHHIESFVIPNVPDMSK
jgi:hypothetical protein